MKIEHDFNVKLPTELIEDFLKDVGIKDGMIQEHQELTIDEVTYDSDDRYLEFTVSSSHKWMDK
jgi:hypothetical protein